MLQVGHRGSRALPLTIASPECCQCGELRIRSHARPLGIAFVKSLILLSCLLVAAVSLPVPASEGVTLVEVRKIWDAGEHNAFTDLIRFRDRWWCTFREAEDHVGGDGKIRVITSRDGKTWESAALIGEKDVDLRDPKFSITPDRRLMIVAGGSIYLGTKQLKGRQPRVLFSADGRNWTQPRRVLGDGDWLWRVTWHQGKAYSAVYNHGPGAGNAPEWTLKLYRSDNGEDWELVTPLAVPDRPNETTLRFLASGELMALVRREAGTKNGWIGTARAPYTEWTWAETSERLGGPNFIQLPDGSLWAGSRRHGKTVTTAISRMTRDKLEPVLDLPSGGDNSYPGLVWRDGRLWVSYYSSHEGKTSIYLAQVKLPKQ